MRIFNSSNQINSIYKFLLITLIITFANCLRASQTISNNDFLNNCKKDDLSFIEYQKNYNENFYFLDNKQNIHLMKFKNWKSRKRFINNYYKINTLKKDLYTCIFLGKIGNRYRDLQRPLSMRPEHQIFNEYRIENNSLVEYICKKEEDDINMCERYLIAKSVD